MPHAARLSEVAATEPPPRLALAREAGPASPTAVSLDRPAISGTLALVVQASRRADTEREESQRALVRAEDRARLHEIMVGELTARLQTAEAGRREAEERGDAVARRASDYLRDADHRVAQALKRLADLEAENRFLLDIMGRTTPNGCEATADEAPTTAA